MSAFANRAPAQLLVIHCTMATDGLFYHSAYEGRMRRLSMGMDVIVSDAHWLSVMRKTPEKFAAAMQEFNDIEEEAKHRSLHTPVPTQP